MNAFLTDPAAIRARQLAGFARAKRNSLAAAIEALDEVGLHSSAVALRVTPPEAMQEVLAGARAILCEMMVTSTDRTPRVIAGYETALGAVTTAWSWSVMS